MVKLSDLLSKQLICLDTATVEGTICNITFDSSLCMGKCLELFCEDDDSPEKKYVHLKNVSAIECDAVVVKKRDSIFYEWQASGDAFNPINCACYSPSGENLGQVRDIILDGARVDKIVLSTREFTPKDLVSYSDYLLIFNDTNKPIKISRPKAKVPKPIDYANATLHASLQTTQSPLVCAELGEKKTAIVPTFISPKSTKVLRSPLSTPVAETSYNFLLGKIVHSSIFDSSGKIIIAENTHVTLTTISAARASGKLVQLALRAY